MAILEIVTVPAPILRRKARPVKEFSPALQKLIDDMVDTMRVAPGVGLAGPQVNMPLRVIVVEYSDSDDEDAPPKLYTVVNPEITRIAGDMITGVEGCLSIPGIIGEVERHETVTVKGLTRQGQPFRLKATGWLARIFQHEIDHLEGVLFTDTALRVWRPGSSEEPEEYSEDYSDEDEFAVPGSEPSENSPSTSLGD